MAPPHDPAARADQLLTRVVTVWAWAGGAALLVVSVVTMTNVGAFTLHRIVRTVGLSVAGLPGYEDMVRLVVSSAVPMMLPLCALRRGHITVDLLAGRLPAVVARALDRLWAGVTVAVAFGLAWSMALGLLETRADRVMSRVLGWPEWPFYLTGVISLVLWAAVVAIREHAGPAEIGGRPAAEDPCPGPN